MVHCKVAVALFSILLVIAASGCTTTPSSGGAGVVVESFEPDFGQIYSGEEFQLQAKIRNTGLTDAKNVEVELFNTGKDKASLQCQEKNCGQSFGLLRADPTNNVQGEIVTCAWSCKGIDIPAGLSVDFSPGIRTIYSYETHTIKSFTLVSAQEMRTLQSTGKSLPSQSVSTTGGPISLTINVNGPIRLIGDSIKFPISVDIQNSGGGFVSLRGSDAENSRNKITFRFASMDGVTIDCQTLDESNHIVELWKGQTATVTCEMTVTGAQTPSGTSIETKYLEAVAEYDYSIDTMTSVTVTGHA